jgi:hypothetical protein
LGLPPQLVRPAAFLLKARCGANSGGPKQLIFYIEEKKLGT